MPDEGRSLHLTRACCLGERKLALVSIVETELELDEGGLGLGSGLRRRVAWPGGDEVFVGVDQVAHLHHSLVHATLGRLVLNRQMVLLEDSSRELTGIDGNGGLVRVPLAIRVGTRWGSGLGLGITNSITFRARDTVSLTVYSRGSG
jgi:hypothetical protein